MANTYYNPETGKFVHREHDSLRPIVWRTVGVGALSVIVACLLFWGMKQTVGAPDQLLARANHQTLAQELQTTRHRLEQYLTQLNKLAQRDQTLYRTILQAQPISSDILQMGVGGALSHPLYSPDSSEGGLLQATAQAVRRLEQQLSLRQKSYARLMELAKERKKRLKQQPAILPVNGSLTSGYGMRYHPVYHSRRMHSGVDLSADWGTPIYATGAGIITHAGPYGGYGICIYLTHPATGYETRYAHLSSIPDHIQPGVHVERGDLIGYSGSTGLSTGPHLHYEVRTENGESLNPAYFFIPEMTPKRYRAAAHDSAATVDMYAASID